MKFNDPDKINLNFKYFHFLATLFILSFVLSNILAVKISDFFGFQIPSGMITFPLSYIFSDILTEVYGFHRARQLIWFAVICEIGVVFFIRIAIALPPSIYWQHEDAFKTILGPEWRIVGSSCIAYLLGDFTNCCLIAKLKIKFANKFIAFRFIGSTAIGVLVDNLVFTILAFSWILPVNSMAWLVVGQYIIKIIYEIMMSPFSVKISQWLKKKEGIDIYDLNTNFHLFKLGVSESK